MLHRTVRPRIGSPRWRWLLALTVLVPGGALLGEHERRAASGPDVTADSRRPEPVPVATVPVSPAAAVVVPPPAPMEAPVPSPSGPPVDVTPSAAPRQPAQVVSPPAPAPPSAPPTQRAPSGPLEASAPTRVDVPAVRISAPVDPLGLNPDGTLEVPGRFARAGWYTGRPTPGETGPAVIVAHRSSRRGPGAFWALPGVKPGDEIMVTRADGRRVVFAVDRVEQHRKSEFPTAAVYGPVPDVGLRLITCGGPFERALGDHYRDNVIVFARMVGLAL